MKTFDLFQKVTVESSFRPTIIGAIISLLAIISMVYILFKQLHEYFFKPLINKNSFIFQDHDGISKVQTNIELTFSNLPCSIISVDQEDLIGHHRLNIKDTLKHVRVEQNKGLNDKLFDPHVTQELTKAINNKEGCIVSGTVPISKVKGDIHISFHAYREVFSYILNNKLSDKISMAHSFSLLNFGDNETLRKVLYKFDMIELEANFNRLITLPHYESYGPEYDFDYFIKIIPQVFEDEYTNEIFIAYQYSLTHKAKVRNDPTHMPIITINYDYSPVAVKYTMEKRSLLHLITDICALVGGVFVIFNILNNIIVYAIKEDSSQSAN